MPLPRLAPATYYAIDVIPQAGGQVYVDTSAAFILGETPGRSATVLYGDGQIERWVHIDRMTRPNNGGNSGQRRRVRFRVFAYGYHHKTRPCAYCGAQITFPESTVDHVEPRALGGLDVWENYALACGDCNTRKAHHATFRILFPIDVPKIFESEK